MFHYNLNYHGAAFEQVDHYLRNTMVILSQPPAFFKSCVMCAKDIIVEMPMYLSNKLGIF